MSEWRDISSAPRKHLSRFLVYAKPRSDDEQVVYEVRFYDDKWGCGIRLNDGYGTLGERDILARVTHWRPSPKPPKFS